VCVAPVCDADPRYVTNTCHFGTFAGSARTGYLPTPRWLSVGTALGISSAALDPTGDMLLAAKVNPPCASPLNPPCASPLNRPRRPPCFAPQPDRAATRFWLTVLGLTLGDWLRFERGDRLGLGLGLGSGLALGLGAHAR
jgi:hypothetical protein